MRHIGIYTCETIDILALGLFHDIRLSFLTWRHWRHARQAGFAKFLFYSRYPHWGGSINTCAMITQWLTHYPAGYGVNCQIYPFMIYQHLRGIQSLETSVGQCPRVHWDFHLFCHYVVFPIKGIFVVNDVLLWLLFYLFVFVLFGGRRCFGYDWGCCRCCFTTHAPSKRPLSLCFEYFITPRHQHLM